MGVVDMEVIPTYRSLAIGPADAREVMRALIRDLNLQTRNGRPVPGWAHRVLPDLAVIADSPLDRADIGTE
ncbi:hypothetical protein, partial [Pimelobacter simplex]|uniref:hypothetical protein n=1 Tax=Nocardioides simplex TaxID=2045 RepID=UPI001931525D|nr:hypothetical protein [Pimelobacter simplex]